MMAAQSRDCLDRDDETVIAQRRRHSWCLHGADMRRLVKRSGVKKSMWSYVDRCWLIPLGDLPPLIPQSEKDRRVLLIEDRVR